MNNVNDKMGAGSVSTPEASGPPHVRRSLLAFVSVAGCVTLATLGANLPSPMYPVYQRDFGLSSLDVSVAFAAYALALIPALVVSGGLSDAIGRKPVLLGSLAAGVLGSGLLVAAQGLALLIIGRIFQGVAVGIASGAAAGALRETHPADDEDRAAQISSAAMVGGGAIGPIFAGLLVEFLPWPRQLAFVLHLVVIVIVFAMVVFAYKPQVRRTRWRPQLPKVPMGMRAMFGVSSAAAGLSWAVTALFMVLVPSFMSESLGIDNAVATGGMVTVILGSSALMQFIANSWNRIIIQRWGLVGVVIGLILLLASEMISSVQVLVTSAVVAGVGQGLVFLGATKTINLASPTAMLGRVTSAYFTVVYLGVGVPVIGVGFLATVIGLVPAVTWFSAVTITLCLAVLVAMFRGSQRHR